MSADLLYQLREALATNTRMQVSLAAREQEASALRDLVDATSEMQSQDVQAAKIIELAKKNRSLNLSLERERQKVIKLQSDVVARGGDATGRGVAACGVALDAEMVEDVARSIVEEAAAAAEVAQKEAASWKERVQQQTNKMAQLEQKVFTLEIEVKKLQRALVREVGEEVPLSKVLDEGSDWKGRREQLIALRDQVKQLRAAQGQPYTETRQDAAAKKLIGQISRERSADQERLLEEAVVLRVELNSAKQKCEGALSRRKVVENELASLKEKVAVVLGKTQNDDKLIAALRAEVNALKKGVNGANRGGTADGASNSTGDAIAGSRDLDEAWNEVSVLRRKTKEQNEQISRQEQIIHALQQQLQVAASPPAGVLEAM